ncbi:MAG: Stp1/IreP family PP2C-type Ser/Thr phosphatase [Eubacterium sp.]|nr:Stp1/IreP family PP2C-type Ser/Thr phosphatase [Eubacterium sp.]
MKVYAKTDIGNAREENQDCVWTGELEGEAAAVILCDGMGGENAGGYASATTVEFIRDRLIKGFRSDITRNQIRNLLITSVTGANSVVYDTAIADEEKSGMGTTCVAGIIHNERAYIINVGDSRCYFFYDDNMQQITKDHTYIRKLIEKGIITYEESKTHPDRNRITKAVGVMPFLTPDYFELDVKKNDLLLFCSDGLSSYAEDIEIANVVAKTAVSQCCDKLIDYVNKHGGRDNVTVAVVSI